VSAAVTSVTMKRAWEQMRSGPKLHGSCCPHKLSSVPSLQMPWRKMERRQSVRAMTASSVLAFSPTIALCVCVCVCVCVPTGPRLAQTYIIRLLASSSGTSSVAASHAEASTLLGKLAEMDPTHKNFYQYAAHARTPMLGDLASEPPKPEAMRVQGAC